MTVFVSRNQNAINYDAVFQPKFSEMLSSLEAFYNNSTSSYSFTSLLYDLRKVFLAGIISKESFNSMFEWLIETFKTSLTYDNIVEIIRAIYGPSTYVMFKDTNVSGRITIELYESQLENAYLLLGTDGDETFEIYAQTGDDLYEPLAYTEPNPYWTIESILNKLKAIGIAVAVEYVEEP